MGTVRDNGGKKAAEGKEGQHRHQDPEERPGQRQSSPFTQRSPAEEHNQYVADPLAHFLAIPWAARLLTDPATFGIAVPDRRPLASSGGERLVRRVLNGAGTVRACVTFFAKPPARGGEQGDGEDPERPFLLFNVLLDLGEDLCGYEGVLHGGMLAVVLDETMCVAAGNQSRESALFPLPPSSSFTTSSCCCYYYIGHCYLDVLNGSVGDHYTLLRACQRQRAPKERHVDPGCVAGRPFTAKMSITFLRPVKLPGPVIARARVVKKEGRKIHVRGAVEDGEGNVLAESEALMIDKATAVASKL
ncbi:hypothetical protein VTH06DRAFT_3028 [Thermothelomyces fergusii]